MKKAKQTYVLSSLILAAALVGGVSVPASAAVSDDVDVTKIAFALDGAASGDVDGIDDSDVLARTVNQPVDESGEVAINVTTGDVAVLVPASASGSVQVGVGSEAILIDRPFAETAGTAVEIQPGVVANGNSNGTTTVTAVKDDGAVQIATILDGVDSPERFEYELGLPVGSRLEAKDGLIFIFSSDDTLIGGFTPAWARDANGVDVPTHYELDGTTITQVVEHRAMDSTVYPVVADPAYARGMISQVKWERWANGGYELRLTVTALARATQRVNPGFVYKAGLDDLREHHPNSMQYKTMAQQWDCHVVGLPGTINIDLESYRRSWDGWRAGILPALIQKNPAAACNW